MRTKAPINQPAPDRSGPKFTPAAVWEAPATFNRATRRSVGLLSRIWRWDLNASEETRRTYVPRYIRRHFSTNLTSQTRRARKHRAVILRISRAKGIV